MNGAYLLDGIRTPIGKYGGALARIRPDDLAASVLRELILRNSSIDPALIGEVVLGCANQAGEDNRNVARMSALLAGLPETVPAETINRLCASGLSSIISASRSLILGEFDFALAGGVESMSRAPFVLGKSDVGFPRSAEIYDTSIGWRFVNPRLHELYGTDSMGETAENLAERYSINREKQDAYALRSQQKYQKAKDSLFFQDEILPVEVKTHPKATVEIVSTDEFPRADTTMESLTRLKAVFRQNGTVTAGNASGINDGACAVILANEHGLTLSGAKPLAKIISYASAGVAPSIMGIGPVEAVRKALERASLTLKDMDIIEINEAFAAQILSCTEELGIDAHDENFNPHGGAIAIGHPLGMSGARLVLSTARALKVRHGRYAVVALCVGVGQGVACIIEAI